MKFKFIKVFIILLVISSINSCKENQGLDNNSEISKDIWFAFFGVKYIERNQEPKFDISDIKDDRDKITFDKKLRYKLFELMNMPLIQFKKPKIDEITSIDKGDYTEKKIFLYTSNMTGRYAYLLVPKIINRKMPAVMAMHQHGGFYEYGKDEVVGNAGNKDLFYGKELAERGYVVLAIDAPLFGDSYLSVKETNTSPEIMEEIQAQQLIEIGHPPIGIMIQEEIMALNILSSLSYVDNNRIGCIGHSMGGTRCMYLAALDNRIKSTVLSSSVANIRQHAESAILKTWLTVLPGVAKYVDTEGLLTLIAPRSLMIIYSEEDPIFPKIEAENKINKTAELYKKLGKETYFSSIYLPKVGHELPREARERAYNFFEKHLKNS